MKSVELQLNKRLLIVESEADYFGYRDYHLKLICKGSELTEDIAKGIVVYDDVNAGHPDFVNNIPYLNYKTEAFEYYNPFSALESFISAIESKGYRWGGNPLGAYEDNIIHGDASEFFKNWQEAESRTFTPEKTLIFEIL